MRNSVSERREIAWRKWQRQKNAYSFSLGSGISSNAKSYEIDLAIFEGDLQYRNKLEEERLPVLFQTGERMIETREQPFYSQPTDDPVYKFLIDAERNLGETALKVYNEMHSSAPFDEEDRDVFIEGKRGSLKSMIRYLETRGTMRRSWEDNVNSLRIDSEEKYQYLLSFVNEVGLFNQETLERFVRELPCYPWEKFFWPES
ncbi:MAG: hypothetical protein WC548_00820 [Candidatus Pacearchaeota archaeon]